MSIESDELPAAECKGLSFDPIPEFDDPAVVFGADLKTFFNRYDLPKIPREYERMAETYFFKGGSMPAFRSGLDRTKAARAIKAWLSSFAPAHEAKIATVGYALWQWGAKQ